MGGVVIRVLEADYRGFEGLGVWLGTVLACRQCAKPVKKRNLVSRIHLNCRRNDAWIVKRPHCNLDWPAGFESQRRTALNAESALRLIGACEATRTAAGPLEIMRGHQGSEKPSEGLLTHATVANRRAAKPRGAKTDRAALAPAGVEGSVHRAMSQVVPSFESFTTTPMAASSSRMRSDSLKFFAARAAARAAIRL